MFAFENLLKGHPLFGQRNFYPFSAVKLCDSKCLLEILTAYFFVGTDSFKSCLKIGAG